MALYKGNEKLGMYILSNSKPGNSYLGDNPIIPKTTDIIIPKNTFFKEETIIAGEPNLLPENIKDGINIFGTIGTLKNNSFPNGRKWYVTNSIKVPIDEKVKYYFSQNNFELNSVILTTGNRLYVHRCDDINLKTYMDSWEFYDDILAIKYHNGNWYVIKTNGLYISPQLFEILMFEGGFVNDLIDFSIDANSDIDINFVGDKIFLISYGTVMLMEEESGRYSLKTVGESNYWYKICNDEEYIYILTSNFFYIIKTNYNIDWVNFESDISNYEYVTIPLENYFDDIYFFNNYIVLVNTKDYDNVGFQNISIIENTHNINTLKIIERLSELSTTALVNICYGNGVWIFYGAEQNSIYISTNNLKTYIRLTKFNQCYSLAYGNNMWVGCFEDNSGDICVYYSEDGFNWFKATYSDETILGLYVNNILFMDNCWFIVADNTPILYSPTWQSTPVNNAPLDPVDPPEPPDEPDPIDPDPVDPPDGPTDPISL